MEAVTVVTLQTSFSSVCFSNATPTERKTTHQCHHLQRVSQRHTRKGEWTQQQSSDLWMKADCTISHWSKEPDVGRCQWVFCLVWRGQHRAAVNCKSQQMSLCSLRLKPWTFKPSSAHSQRNHCWQPHTSTSSIIQSTYLRFVTFRPVTCLWRSRARRVFRRAHPPVCSSSLPEPQQTGWTTDPSSPANTHTKHNNSWQHTPTMFHKCSRGDSESPARRRQHH